MARARSRWRAASSSINRCVLALRQLKTILAPVLIACLAALPAAGPAFAVPPPPSIFHGTITFEGQTAPDGIPILALINDAQYATSYVQIDQGNSVYSLEVPGDDLDTPEREGGREGDTIQFALPGMPADQTGLWHSGANVLLNLTVFIVGHPTMPTVTPTPSATPSPMPTETSRPIVQPSPTPTGIPAPANQPLPTSTRTPAPTVPPSPTSTALPTPTWTPTRQPPQASLPSPAPTLTLVSTRQLSPTTMSSPASTPGQSQGQRGTPIPSGQSSPDITPSAMPVQTIELAGQPPVTSVSLPTAARTTIPPAQLGPKPVVPLSSETNDSGTRLEGILLVAAALMIALVTCLVIAASVVIRYIRQPR
jgi:hypothetical protein